MPVSTNAQASAGSRVSPLAVARLRAAFDRSRHPMLIADDQRRWVTGNGAACDLLGIAREELPWRMMDEFVAPSERAGLRERWAALLTTGASEGHLDLYVPDRGPVPVEFSATANVLPARHLSVFAARDETYSGQEDGNELDAGWTAADPYGSGRLPLTEREREVMTLVASGLQGSDIAGRLFLSPDTVKTHVRNTMCKLGARTRAHAVAIALVTGQISWETQPTV